MIAVTKHQKAGEFTSGATDGDHFSRAVWGMLEQVVRDAGCPALRLTRAATPAGRTLRLCMGARELASVDFDDHAHRIDSAAAMQFQAQATARTLLAKALATALKPSNAKDAKADAPNSRGQPAVEAKIEQRLDPAPQPGDPPVRWDPVALAALAKRIRTIEGRVPAIARSRSGAEREVRVNRTDRLIAWARGERLTPPEFLGASSRLWLVALARSPS